MTENPQDLTDGAYLKSNALYFADKNKAVCRLKGGSFLKSRVAGERLAFASTDGISRASERKIFYLNRQGFGDACSR